MAGAHPLHDLLAGLAGGTADPHGDDLAAALRDGGHPDLPDAAMAEAIVSYADTAAVEVAEHLAPFVMGHSAVPLDPPAGTIMEVRDGLALLATAPSAGPDLDPLGFADGAATFDPAGLDTTAPVPAADPAPGDPADLDFGTGTGTDAGADFGLPEPAELAAPGPLDPAVPELDPAGLDDLFPTAGTERPDAGVDATAATDAADEPDDYGDLAGGSFGAG